MTRAAPFSILLVLVLACLAVPLRAQIYESICRDANCTDIALGPLALIPQCYRTSLGSIGLSLNATNSSVLNICFYGADDCVDHLTTTNATVEKTCHSFVNGQASECPFLRGMNGSLYILFTWDADNIKLLQDMMELLPSYQHAKRQILNNFFGLTEFGNWCGPGHGGTRDCCDDDPCPACDYSQGLTSACLSQCPARDDLDRACAVHDFCTTNYDYHRVLPNDNFSCSSVLGTLDAEYCACDCQLVRTAMRVRSRNNLYRSALIFLFTHTTSCWYQSSSGPVCNKPGNNRILVTDFCRPAAWLE